MKFLSALFANDEVAADSIVFASLAAILTLCGVTGYLAIVDHSTWSPVNFGGAAATIIAAAGGLKTARERWGCKSQEGQQQ